MKVLFLDIDGVLNNVYTKEKIKTHLGEFTATDPELVERYLKWLDKHPEVSVVLSSTWRLDPVRWNYAFTDHLKSVGIHWISETLNIGRKGKEIYSWLSTKEGITHVAILDDTSDMHPVGRYLIQTSEKFGLQDKHLERLDRFVS